MANEYQDPYDQAYWEKGKQNSNIPMMETKVIHPMTMAKEKKGGQENGKSPIAEKTEEQPAIQQTAPSTEPTYAGWTDQDWDPSWNWSEEVVLIS